MRVTWSFPAGLLFLLTIHVLGADDPPAALRAFVETRNDLLTGEVSLSRVTFRGRSDEPGKPEYFTARFAGDSYLLEDRGDEKGVLGKTPEGMPDLSPVRYLMHDGRQWEKREANAGARLQLTQTDVLDIRALGTAFRLPQAARVDRLLDSRTPCEYSETVTAAGLIVIGRRIPGFPRRTEVTLDPSRGWNIVRSVMFENDKTITDERITLKQFGDTWYPERWQFFEATHDEGRTPAEEIVITHAAFNRPDQPIQFTPADIGIDVGTPIQVFVDSNAAAQGQSTRMVWDGEKPVGDAEFRKRLDSGELKLGPLVRAFVDKTLAEGQPIDVVLDNWTAYTRRFIARYELDTDQSQKALAILDDCKGQAGRYVQQKADAFKKARERAAEVLAGKNTSSDQRERELKECKERMNALEQPLWRIYELSLVPRLNRLPTRAQRDAEARRKAEEHMSIEERESK